MATGVALKSLATGTFFDLAGDAESGRSVFVYQRGTTNQVTVYQDPGLTTPYTQPLTTGADGVAGAVPGYVASGQSIDFVDQVTGATDQAEPLLAGSVVSGGSAGGQNPYPRILLDNYYDAAIFVSKTAAINAAVAAAQALGGTLECRHGRVYSLDTGPLSIAPGLALKVHGNKAALQANWGKPRCVDFTRTADYQTFQYVEIDDLIFDANGLTASTSQSIVGNLIDGNWGQRINADYVRVRRCRWVNVPVGTSVTYQCFSLGSRHLASGETQTNLTDIRLDDAKMRGGNVGAAVLGSGASTVEVYHDKIYLDLDHDTGVLPTASGVGANAQIGGSGWGDNCEVHVKGANSSDVGVEIDGMQNSDVYGSVTDARNAAFFVRNFHAPPVPVAQVATFHKCYHRVVNLNPDNTFNATGFQLSHTATPNPMFGTMILDKCVSDSRATNAAGRPIYVAGPARRLVTNDLRVNYDNISMSLSADQTFSPIYMTPAATDSNSIAAPFTWINRGGELNVNGTITLNSHNFFYRGVRFDLPSAADLTLDGGTPMSFSTNLTAAGLTAGSCAHILVGPASAPATPPLVRGEFRFRIKSFAGSDTAPYGAFVQEWQGGTTPIINLDPELTFPHCDCAKLPTGSAGREVFGVTQAAANTNGQFQIRYPALKIAGGLTPTWKTETNGSVSSPFVFKNTDGRRKKIILTASSQALSAVAIRDRVNNVTETVLSSTSAGPFELEPHNCVVFTFAASPSTITLVSLVAEN